MAELVKNYSNGSAIKIVYSYTQNVSKNQSTVTMTLYVHRDSYGPSWNTHCDSYMQLDGSNVMTYDGSFNIGTSWVKIGSTVSKTVTHNADGTKTIALKGFFDSEGLTSKLQNLTVTGNVTLKTIPRASSFTLSTSTVTAGSTNMTVNISRASSSFTHTVQWKLGSHSKSNTGVTTSSSYTIPESWLDAIPNSTSGTGTVTVTTYNGGTKIGSASKSFTVKAASDIVPSFTGITFTRIDGDVPEDWGLYVRTKSKVTAKITGAAGVYGSTIKSYSISGGGYSGTSSSLTTGFLNTAGTVTFTAKITDSRGRTATKTASITVVDYSPPILSSVKAFRCNEQGEEQDDGEYISLTAVFSGASVNGKNTLSGQYRTQPEEGSWSSPASITSGQAAIFPASPDTTFAVQVQVSDVFTTISKDTTVNSARFIMDFKAGGKGIAFGKAAEYDDLLDTNWEARFRKGIQMMDANGAFYALIYNGANLWIGALRTDDSGETLAGHHTGKTYISAGIDEVTGQGYKSIYISVPSSESEAQNFEVLHKGNTMQKLWSGSWSSGTITVPDSDQYSMFKITMSGEGTVIIASKNSNFIRGGNSFPNSASSAVQYHFAATFSGTAWTLGYCTKNNVGSTSFSKNTITSIIGIL